jgi:hypothetical protein
MAAMIPQLAAAVQALLHVEVDHAIDPDNVRGIN